MISIVMRPIKAPVVDHEHLYAATVGTKELCRVRARNGRHAEEKLMFCFMRELPGKTVDFSLESFRESGSDDNNNNNNNE